MQIGKNIRVSEEKIGKQGVCAEVFLITNVEQDFSLKYILIKNDINLKTKNNCTYIYFSAFFTL